MPKRIKGARKGVLIYKYAQIFIGNPYTIHYGE
jgi:hypothetical protein